MATSIDSKSMVGVVKRCCACNADVSEAQRFKNKQGMYYCATCVTKEVTLNVDARFVQSTAAAPAPKIFGVTIPPAIVKPLSDSSGRLDKKKVIGGVVLVVIIIGSVALLLMTG